MNDLEHFSLYNIRYEKSFVHISLSKILGKVASDCFFTRINVTLLREGS
jgi:hypothetical protein